MAFLVFKKQCIILKSFLKKKVLLLKKILLFLFLNPLFLSSGLRMNKFSIAYYDESGAVKAEGIDSGDSLYKLAETVARIFLPEGPIHSIQIVSASPKNYSININLFFPREISVCENLGPTGKAFQSRFTPQNAHLSPVFIEYENIKTETDLSREAYIARIEKILNAWTLPIGQPQTRRASSWLSWLFAWPRLRNREILSSLFAEVVCYVCAF